MRSARTSFDEIHHAAPGALDADRLVAGRVVVAPLEERRTVGTVEGDDPERPGELGHHHLGRSGLQEGRELAGRGDRHLRPDHLRARSRRQAVAARKAREKLRKVRDGRIHRSRRARPAALVVRREAAVDPVAVGEVLGEVGAPHHAGPRHAEAVEHAALHLVADIQAESGLQHELQQDDPLARIRVASAGIEMEPHLPVGLEKREIGQAARVAQEDTRRELAPARLALQRVVERVLGQMLREVVRNRPVEIDFPLVDQLHDHVGEGELGQRRAVHDRVGLERQVLRDVAAAPRTSRTPPAPRQSPPSPGR